MAKQEIRLKAASDELAIAQHTLDEKQAELDAAQGKYNEAMREKNVSLISYFIMPYWRKIRIKKAVWTHLLILEVSNIFLPLRLNHNFV